MTLTAPTVDRLEREGRVTGSPLRIEIPLRTMILAAGFTFVLLTACRVKGALAIGTIAGIADILPYIGTFLSVGPALAASASRGSGALLALPVASAIRMLIEELRVNLPGEDIDDRAARAADARAEREYERRAKGVPAEAAAALAMQISEDEDQPPPSAECSAAGPRPASSDGLRP